MSATTASTLIQRVRRYVEDWPDIDSTTASIASGGTTLTVGDSSIYAVNWLIQVDTEMMRVKALASGTSLTVTRGAQGTSAASHASGASILVRPAWGDQQILDSLNGGINASWPYYYKAVVDTSLTGDGITYEFTLPSGFNYLTKVETKIPGLLYYSKIDGWTVKRGSSPILQFAVPPYPSTLRLYGYGPFPQLTSTSDSLDAQWPSWGDDVLVEFASQRLLMSGEAGRAREDTGARDDRENANRPGVSMAVANGLFQRAMQRFQQQPMPPMVRHSTRLF